MNERSKKVLDPIERVAEVLFGVIMVMTVTGTLSVAEAGRGEIRTMLAGALGCNLAWGIIDAVLYLMNRMAERGKEAEALRAVREAVEPAEGQRILAEALPAVVASVMSSEELEGVRQRLRELPEPSRKAELVGEDWMGALGVFLIVFLSTLPVVLPFVLMDETRMALRVSNGVGIVMLFLAGCAFGRMTGHRPWVRGVAMVVLGLVLVALTMALGG